MHLAVSRKIDISEGEAVLVDVGGGSVEVTLTSGGVLIESRTLKVGTVRMLQVLSNPERGFSDFMAQIEEIKSETRDWTTGALGHHLVGQARGDGRECREHRRSDGQARGQEGHVLCIVGGPPAHPNAVGVAELQGTSARTASTPRQGRRDLSRGHRRAGAHEHRMGEAASPFPGWD